MRARFVAVTATVAITLAGCHDQHPSSSFDETAVRALIATKYPADSEDLTERLVRVVRNACLSGSTATMVQLHAEDPDGWQLAEVGCPAKTAAASS